MKVILNLTQHAATEEQLKAGVVELPIALKEKIVELITFNYLPTNRELKINAEAVAKLVTEYSRELACCRPLSNAEQLAFDLDSYAPGLNSFNNVSMVTVMIGGAPFFMSHLEDALKRAKIRPLYAFSERVSAEGVDENGKSRKVSFFKHLGFVEA